MPEATKSMKVLQAGSWSCESRSHVQLRCRSSGLKFRKGHLQHSSGSCLHLRKHRHAADDRRCEESQAERNGIVRVPHVFGLRESTGSEERYLQGKPTPTAPPACAGRSEKCSSLRLLSMQRTWSKLKL